MVSSSYDCKLDFTSNSNTDRRAGVETTTAARATAAAHPEKDVWMDMTRVAPDSFMAP